MPDRDIEKISPSGITVDGEPIERYLRAEEASDLLDAVRPADNIVQLYHAPRSKAAEQKGSPGPVKDFSRREINLNYWEKLLHMATQLDDGIFQALLSGKSMNGGEIRELLEKTFPDMKKREYESRMSYLSRKTDLNKLIGVTREHGMNVYKLVDAALDLSPADLLSFAYKSVSSMNARKLLLAKFPALGLIMSAEPATDPPETGTGKDDAPPFETPTEDMQQAISKAIAKALGVKVEVSGRIEIVFKLGD